MSDSDSSSFDASPRASSAAPAQVGPGAFLTLHYRVSLPEDGGDLINTFEGKPATLQLGIGQLSEGLEACLLGLVDGDHKVFELPEGQAYGPRNPDLVLRVSNAMLARESRPDEAGSFQPGDLVEFPAPDGGSFAGVMKSQDDEGAVFDFNHPLAGKAVRFEVKILGVL